jgi:hypothetical protein
MRHISSGIAERSPSLSLLFVPSGSIFMKYSAIRFKRGQRVLAEFINLQLK